LYSILNGAYGVEQNLNCEFDEMVACEKEKGKYIQIKVTKNHTIGNAKPSIS
jgi:hypothetical protein